MNQIDEYVPTRFLRYLGALKTQSGRSRFYVSFAQFAMIAILFYNDSATIQRLFPSILAWGTFLAVMGGVLMIVDYLVVFPSEITYSQGQAARENRNPTYKQVRENGRRLDRIERQLADGGRFETLADGSGCVDVWRHTSSHRDGGDDDA